MGAEFGRVSGPLLANNLVRNGIDLTFRNYSADSDLLYLDVNNGLIGINTATPSRALDVPVKIRTTNLISDTLSNIANFTISTNNIQNTTGIIYITPNQASNPQIVMPGLATANLTFSTNVISGSTTNTYINITPNGTGKSIINNDILISADLHATGNITWAGDITLGNSNTDNIRFTSDINSDILPSQNPTTQLISESGDLYITEDGNFLVETPDFNLGTINKQWATINSTFANTNFANANSTIVTSLYAGSILINGASISSSVSTADVKLTPNGAGLVKFNGTNFLNLNSIVNNTNTDFTFTSTDRGYFKFAGTTGVVLPTGTSDNKPAQPQLSELRYNTTLNAAEIYNGTVWQPAIGNSPTLTLPEVNDIMDIWTIILG